MSLTVISGADMAVQVHVGQKPTPEGMRHPQRHEMPMFNKPSQALWTAPLDETCNRSNWQDNDIVNGWLLTPSADARILLIRNYTEAAEIARLYPAPVPYYFADSLPHMHGEDGGLIDFAALFEDYDGLQYNHSAPDDDNGPYATFMSWHRINGWDIESTAWGRWCFDSVIKHTD